MGNSKCQHCGKEFRARRSDAKFCSSTCKARAWDQKNSTARPSIQDSLRGVIQQQETTDRPQPVSQAVVKEPVPRLKELAMEIMNLKTQETKITGELRTLHDHIEFLKGKLQSPGELVFITGGAILAASRISHPVSAAIGGLIGRILFQVVGPEPGPEQKQAQVSLEEITVRERALNVRLTSVRRLIAVRMARYYAIS